MNYISIITIYLFSYLTCSETYAKKLSELKLVPPFDTFHLGMKLKMNAFDKYKFGKPSYYDKGRGKSEYSVWKYKNKIISIDTKEITISTTNKSGTVYSLNIEFKNADFSFIQKKLQKFYGKPFEVKEGKAIFYRDYKKNYSTIMAETKKGSAEITLKCVYSFQGVSFTRDPKLGCEAIIIEHLFAIKEE